MKEYLFIIVLLFSSNLVAQSTVEEKTEKKTKSRNNSNVAPAYCNDVKLELDQEPSGSSLSSNLSATISDASIKLERTFGEIKQMSTRKTPTPDQFQKLNYELIKIKNANQNAFEYHLYYYKVGNYDFDRIHDLKMAEKLQPNHPEVLKSLSAYHYIMDDEKSLKNQLIQMDAAKHFASELTSFANDVLKSLPKNAVLITHGDDDTYPLLIEQYINSTRKDVQIISLDHLQSKTYREKLNQEGFKLPRGEIINTSYFKEFVLLNEKDLIIATSVPKTYLETIKDKIHVEGLGLSIENNTQSSSGKRQAQLYDNTIKKALQEKLDHKYGKIISNYLPFLFEVRNYWIDQGNTSKIKEVEADIIEIGKLSNKLEQVLKMLK